MDCEGNCYPSVYLTFLNNGFCDEGTYGIDFSCEAWGYDGAICSSNWTGDLGEASYSCNESPTGGDCADECNVPNGNNTSCADCLDIPNGPNSEDNCGVCDSDPSNDCVQDCFQVWGGEAELDECGVCGGSGIPAGDCDCNGNILDCNSVCGGASLLDECGICGGNGIPDGECDCEGNSLDCNGECGGNATLDNCGVCDSDPANDCTPDCNGDWGVRYNIASPDFRLAAEAYRISLAHLFDPLLAVSTSLITREVCVGLPTDIS